MSFFKLLYRTALVGVLLLKPMFVSADLVSDTGRVLDYAQREYPELFPSSPPTSVITPWIFRFYPETGIYAGVNQNDEQAYVMGGVFGSTPTPVGSLAALLAQIPVEGSSFLACDVSELPEQLIVERDGNVFHVRSEDCIVLGLENEVESDLCPIPPDLEPTETGIHVLGEVENLTLEFTGVQVDDLNLTEQIQGPVRDVQNQKHCAMNVPTEEVADWVIDHNVCYDMTASFQLLDFLPNVTVTPPVLVKTKGTSRNQRVDDCFATDADTIEDFFTKEVWQRNPASGGFERIL